MPEKKIENSFSFYGVLFAVAFSINWVWEVSQTFAFDMSGVSIVKMLLFCTFASIIDGIVTVFIFWVLQRFLKKFSLKFYVAAALLGALTAIFFEQMAFAFNLWSYDKEMPVLPFVEIGLLPFVQLTILVPIAIWLTVKLRKA